MKLVQPAIYVGPESKKWVMLKDVLEIAEREFSMEADEVWSDLCEWQKPYGGLLWTTGDTVKNTKSQNPAQSDIAKIYVPVESATTFYEGARKGVRNVRWDPQEEGHHFQWKHNPVPSPTA